ncbi:MAG: T9SS type A sorting domain-containing protein [Flavobacterium sp.]|nr:MAG: T9SS type A sorting domain-containing protein [Flavobacterium sp.]
MKKVLLLLIALLFNVAIYAQVGCGDIFTDPAGASANYQNNTNYTVTIYPDNPGEAVKVTFNSFATEVGYDALYVFDGNSTNAPQLSSDNDGIHVPGNLPGGYWGTTIPGPFTSTSDDGSLTFMFRSDSTGPAEGWMADVTCVPLISGDCLRPINFAAGNASTSTINLSWTEPNSGATQWEYLILPFENDNPAQSDNGILVSSNPTTVSGLIPATRYSAYIRTKCPAGGYSYWSGKAAFTTKPINDDCANAAEVPVNLSNGCGQVTHGSLAGATASDEVPVLCDGTPDDDVWFKFTATSPTLNVNLRNLPNDVSLNLKLSLYSGNCGALQLVMCSYNPYLTTTSLVVGQTYYLRAFSFASTPAFTEFDVCITTASICATANPVCGVHDYANTTGVGSLGQIGCLYNSPNPTYFSVKIATSGSVSLTMTQSTFDSPTPNLDVDYAAWGPFSSQAEACAAISSGTTPLAGLSTGCSYSANPIETFNIANAVAGQYYILLITNFSNQPGVINIGINPTSTGSIDCSGIRLEAFIDTNNNGTKEIGEPPFTMGEFNYEVNNNGDIHNASSSTGSYIVYDSMVSNSYDINYVFNPQYATAYAAPTTYTDIVVSTGQMTTYYFPVQVLQDYQDLMVSLIPESQPIAGSTYSNKMVFKNNGTQTIASGTIAFDHDGNTAITNVSQAGTVATSNGFTYNFTNLLPFESRSITVTMSVPAIPGVSIGQLLTNNVSGTFAASDFIPTNNNATVTQAVAASYDPNDKTESHGDKILFSSFNANDYLYYTVRFENTGTTEATNISVTDMLDQKIDENSVAMVNASDDYVLDQLGRSLTWRFDGINLPVSVANTAIGKGFLTFRAKLKPGFAVGDVIPNTALIYFDANPAITTNTFETQFVTSLGTATFDQSNIVLYPNPARNSFEITTQGTSESIASIALYDIIGKQVKKVLVNATQATVNVADLSKGVYIVEIYTESQLRQIKKLVIE